jgi:hypothetical protein
VFFIFNAQLRRFVGVLVIRAYSAFDVFPSSALVMPQ